MSEYKECIIYARVSDKKQRTEGHGLDSQEHRCRMYAQEKGWTVVEVFKEDVSGGSELSDRKAMIALLSFLKRHKKKNFVVLIDDLKRLSRHTKTHWILRDKMASYGAKVECLNFAIGTTAEDEFIETLFAAQGELERKQNKRQVLQKMTARTEAGFWTLSPPRGYRYEKQKGRGSVLVPDEPVASVIREGLEGFASGRFATKSEFRAFVENDPRFPTGKSGKVGNKFTDNVLFNPIYAGHIEYKPWGVTLRPAQNEGLISLDTFQKIQKRLKERAYMPTRPDIREDFILRGAVACGACGNSLTSAWSRGKSGKRHPYYLCQNRKCEYKGKSIRRADLEGKFEDILENVTPRPEIIQMGLKMFEAAWQMIHTEEAKRRTQLQDRRQQIQRSIDNTLDKIVASESTTVTSALEKRIEKLEADKLALDEKMASCGKPKRSFDEMYRTTLDFISNPLKIWKKGGFKERRTLLKLMFSERLIYDRNGAYQTPNLSLPFSNLQSFSRLKMEMVVGRDAGSVP